MDMHPQGLGGDGGGASADALAEAEAELRAVKTSLAVLSQEKEEQGLSLSLLRKHLMQSMEQLTLVQQAIDSKVLKKPVTRSMAITVRDRQRRAAAGVLIARNRALLMALTHALAGMPSPVDPDSYVFSPEERSALLGGGGGAPAAPPSSSAAVVGGSHSSAAATTATTLRGFFERSRRRLAGGGGGGGGGRGDSGGGDDGDDEDDEDDDDSDGGSGSGGTRHPQQQHQQGGGPTLLDAAGAANSARLLSLLGDAVLHDSGQHLSSSGGAAAGAADTTPARGGGGGGARGGGGGATLLLHGPTGGGGGGDSSEWADYGTANCAPPAAAAAAASSGGGNAVLTVGGLTADDLQRALAAAHLGGVTVASIARSQAAARAVRHCLRTSRARPPLGGDNPDVLCRVLSFLPHADLARAAGVCRAWRYATLRADCAVYRHLARSAAIPPSLRGALWHALASTSTSTRADAPVVLSSQLFARLAAWLGFIGAGTAAASHAPHRAAGGQRKRGSGSARRAAGSISAVYSALAVDDDDDDDCGDESSSSSSSSGRDSLPEALSVRPAGAAQADSWTPRRWLSARTLLRIYSPPATPAPSTAASVPAPPAAVSARSRHTIDHTLRLPRLPQPALVSLAPGTDVFDAGPPQPSGGSSSWSAPLLQRQQQNLSLGETVAARISSLYLIASAACQRASEAGAVLRDAASALRSARASCRALLASLRAAALSDEPLAEDASVRFVEAQEACSELEAGRVPAAARALCDATSAAWRACWGADYALVHAVVWARRRHAVALAAAWLAMQRRLAAGAGGGGAGAGSSSGISGCHAYVHPSSGRVLPTFGMELELSTASSAVASLAAAARLRSPPAERAAAAVIAATFASPPPLRLPVGTDEAAALLAAAKAGVLPLPDCSGGSGGGSSGWSGVCVDVAADDESVHPLWPLPPHLADLLECVSRADAGPEEERWLWGGGAGVGAGGQCGGAEALEAAADEGLQACFEPCAGVPLWYIQALAHADETSEALNAATAVAAAAAAAAAGASGGIPAGEPLSPSTPALSRSASVPSPLPPSTPLPPPGVPPCLRVDLGLPFDGSPGIAFAPAKTCAASGHCPPLAAAMPAAWVATAAAAASAATGSQPCPPLLGIPTLAAASTLVLPGLPFASQHGIIDADVRRTFGEVEQPVREAPPLLPPPDDPSLLAQSSLAALFPTSYITLGGGGGDDHGGAGAEEDRGARVPLSAVSVLRGRLRCTLLAYSAYDRRVIGYCQGLNFIAAMLLRHSPGPAAWRILGSLMHAPQYDMVDLFSTGLTRVGLSFHEIRLLLAAQLPRLAGHLVGRGVAPDMFAAGWVMTLFTSLETLPVSYVAPLLGLFILDGWKALFRCILALLDALAPDLLLAGDFAAAVQYLHTIPRHRLPPSAAALLRRAMRFKVTNRMLAGLEAKYRALRATEERAESTLSSAAADAAAVPPAAGSGGGGGDAVVSPAPSQGQQQQQQPRAPLMRVPSAAASSGATPSSPLPLPLQQQPLRVPNDSPAAADAAKTAAPVVAAGINSGGSPRSSSVDRPHRGSAGSASSAGSEFGVHEAALLGGLDVDLRIGVGGNGGPQAVPAGELPAATDVRGLVKAPAAGISPGSEAAPSNLPAPPSASAGVGLNLPAPPSASAGVGLVDDGNTCSSGHTEQQQFVAATAPALALVRTAGVLMSAGDAAAAAGGGGSRPLKQKTVTGLPVQPDALFGADPLQLLAGQHRRPVTQEQATAAGGEGTMRDVAPATAAAATPHAGGGGFPFFHGGVGGGAHTPRRIVRGDSAGNPFDMGGEGLGGEGTTPPAALPLADALFEPDVGGSTSATWDV